MCYYVCVGAWFAVFMSLVLFIIFFFKQKTAYEMRISDWSSDVCSSDLLPKPYTPGYVEADVRLGWKLGEGMELFALGTNLLHKQHDESGDTDRGQLAVRSVSLGARWHF